MNHSKTSQSTTEKININRNNSILGKNVLLRRCLTMRKYVPDTVDPVLMFHVCSRLFYRPVSQLKAVRTGDLRLSRGNGNFVTGKLGDN